VVELLLKHGADIEFIEDEVSSVIQDRATSFQLWEFLISNAFGILKESGILRLLWWLVLHCFYIG
jgi:hypothetical protein